MEDFEISLTFEIKNNKDDLFINMDKLFESGCDDAIISTYSNGNICLSYLFKNKDDVIDIINTSLQKVNKAIPSAVLIELTSNF